MDKLEPGMSIRPNLNIESATSLIERLYGFKNFKLIELNGYDDKNFHVQVNDKETECEVWPHGYVIKVTNSLESQNTSAVDAQTKMALHLGECGINCPQPVRNVKGQFYSLEEISQDGKTGNKHIVRALTFQPGKLLKQIPLNSNTLFNVGRHVALVDQFLKNFYHPAYNDNKSLWSLESIPLVRKFTFAIKNDSRILWFRTIHGDFNEQNVVMSSDSGDGTWRISAILDFGDTQHTCYLFELAVNLCYMILIAVQLSDPLEAAGHVLAGYSTIRTLPDMENRTHDICICARMCQSLVMGAYSYLQEPGNTYLLSTAERDGLF
ncbi:hypothetical protein L9F63_024664 [Diploptera punctata]|uniref:Hydroxylysine kinase n=1 Tax=Diploptera punctata TaxID=6984 RepID=A0AAD7ZFI5_DIPPU|nr:hypothetical protein L9F63_024664 [Diploptera punctata]